MIMPMVHQCPIYVPGFPKERKKTHLKEKNLRNFDIENGKYVQEYILWNCERVTANVNKFTKSGD